MISKAIYYFASIDVELTVMSEVNSVLEVIAVSLVIAVYFWVTGIRSELA